MIACRSIIKKLSAASFPSPVPRALTSSADYLWYSKFCSGDLSSISIGCCRSSALSPISVFGCSLSTIDKFCSVPMIFLFFCTFSILSWTSCSSRAYRRNFSKERRNKKHQEGKERTAEKTERFHYKPSWMTSIWATQLIHSHKHIALQAVGYVASWWQYFPLSLHLNQQSEVLNIVRPQGNKTAEWLRNHLAEEMKANGTHIRLQLLSPKWYFFT